MIEEVALQWAKDAPALLVAAYVIFRLFNLIESLIKSNRAVAQAVEKRNEFVKGFPSNESAEENALYKFFD